MRNFAFRLPLTAFLLPSLAVSSFAADPPATKAAAPAKTPEMRQKEEFFEAKVRPLLAEHCFSCHGPKVQQSGLRLDSRVTMMTGGDSGPAITGNNPDKSLLIEAVRYHGGVQMPPKGKLSDEAIATLATWVGMGAPWPESDSAAAAASRASPEIAAGNHWAFQPIRKPPVPKTKETSWPRSPIDHFILSKLEDAGIAPSTPADKRTLIRRATLDLIGIPPTSAEVGAFLQDNSADSFAKVVDRLLASPHYGERWGRHWLDVARYADTKGYVFNEDRSYPYSYTYRDYVIRSFNEDAPYDRFVREQLAADVLPDRRDDRALAAMGFLTVGRRFLNNQQDIIDDRIDLVTRGLLGLTVSCARCHDHKFDPIPTADYYSLYGVFASCVEPPELPKIPDPTPSKEYPAFLAALEAENRKIDEFLARKREEMLAALRQRSAEYLVALHEIDGNPAHGKLGDIAKAKSLNDKLFRSLVTRWQNSVGEAKKKHDPILGVWLAYASLPANDFANPAKGLSATLLSQADPKTEPSKRVHPLLAKSFADKPPASMREVAERFGRLLAEVDNRDMASKASGGKPLEPDWESLRQFLFAENSPFQFPAGESERLLDRPGRNELAAMRMKIDQVKATHPGSPPRAMVLNDAPNPMNPRVFVRGNPGRQGDPVPRQFLAVVAGKDRKPFQKGSGRLEMAEAITATNNPLTARVLVNRVWGWHFGYGLVTTPSDFGLRSDPPSHPQLLDYLAARFVEEGWSIKNLHRWIMLSSVYQQASASRSECLASDPDNRLLWKFPRRRLDFEEMRDSLLAVSGRLDLSVGGRPVVLTEAPFTARRAVYGFIDRQNLDGLFRSFDFPNPDTTVPQRYVTTVPQQALFLMNHPFVLEQSRALAARPQFAGELPHRERIDRLYRTVYGRSPDAEEFALAEAFLAGPAPEAIAPAWQNGYGEYDETARRVREFHRLSHWTGSAWQFAEKFPDPKAGHLILTAKGGHPGNSPSLSPVRRWTSPLDATISIAGTISTMRPEGDGVRGRIVSSRNGELGQWTAHNQIIGTPVSSYDVSKGETLDFIVDCRQNSSHDSFSWSPTIRVVLARGDGLLAETEWIAEAEFSGPTAAELPPTRWEQLVQTVLLSNEFAFVD